MFTCERCGTVREDHLAELFQVDGPGKICCRCVYGDTTYQKMAGFETAEVAEQRTRRENVALRILCALLSNPVINHPQLPITAGGLTKGAFALADDFLKLSRDKFPSQ